MALDTETMEGQPDRDTFLGVFYEHYVHWLVEPFWLGDLSSEGMMASLVCLLTVQCTAPVLNHLLCPLQACVRPIEGLYPPVGWLRLDMFLTGESSREGGYAFSSLCMVKRVGCLFLPQPVPRPASAAAVQAFLEAFFFIFRQLPTKTFQSSSRPVGLGVPVRVSK